MSCKYKIITNNKVSDVLTEAQLFTMMQVLYNRQNANFSSIAGFLELVGQNPNIKFSYVEAVEVVKELQKEKLESKKAKLIGQDQDFKNAISFLSYLEDKQDSPIQYSVSPIDYIIAEELKNNEALSSPEELQEAANQLQKKWNSASVIGMELHKFLAIAFNHLNDYNDFRNVLWSFKNDSDVKIFQKCFINEESVNALFKALQNARREIQTLIKKSPASTDEIKRDRYYAARLPITETLADGTKVGATIDQLIIDEEGIPHIFNFKFTLTDPKTWPKNKSEKYYKEMAMIQEALFRKGFTEDQISRATFCNIPIWLDFNPDTTEDIAPVNSVKTAPMQNLTIADGEAALNRRRQEIKKYFKSNSPELYSKSITLNRDLLKADLFFKLVYPKLDAEEIGKTFSAQNWIRDAVDKNKIYAATSVEDSKNGIYWYIQFKNQDPIPIKDYHPVNSNQQILDIVKDHLEELSSDIPNLANQLAETIKNSYGVHRAQFTSRNFKTNAEVFERLFAPYFEQYIPDGNNEPQNLWLMLDNPEFTKRNIFLFQNQLNGRIDIIKTSGYDLNRKLPMRYNQNNILGEYEMDLKGITTLDGTYGNLELLQVAAILNELSLSLDEPKFGDIHIVSPYISSESVYMPAKTAMREYTNVSTYLNKYQKPEEKFTTIVDSSNFLTEFECIDNEIQRLQKVIGEGIHMDYIEKLGLEELKRKEGIAAQIQGMRSLCKTIATIFNAIDEQSESINIDKILRMANSTNPEKAAYAKIFQHAIHFINYHTGFVNPEIKKIATFKRYVLPQYANPDANVRHVANLYARELDRLAQDFQDTYIKEIRDIIIEFEKKKGYNNVKAGLVGNTDPIYEKFYKHNSEGKNIFEFVNPYDNTEVKNAQLDEDEVKFLKKILFYKAKVRARGNKNLVFNFKNENDPKLKEFYDNPANNYFLVPLVHSSASRLTRNSLDIRVQEAKNFLKQVSTWDRLKSYAMDKLQRDDSNKNIYGPIEDGIKLLQIPLDMALQEKEYERAELLNGVHEAKFETNIGYLLAEYTESALKYEHMKNVEFASKAILFQLHMLGEESSESAKKVLRESIKEIEDFMKLNIYNRSLMSSFGVKFTETMEPAKRLMSQLFIAGNLKAMFRDSFEGLWQNLSRTITHYHTDLNTNHVMNAYKDVMLNMFKSDRSLNIMSELCLRYRLSNTDESRIAERAKTGKSGVFNYEHMLFKTMTGPDFLNRMVLFVARCRQDGVWNAFSLDENHQLKYDPSKDLRFKAYFHPEGFNEDQILFAKTAYYNAVHQYNIEHSDQEPISFAKELKALPEPYSQNEVYKIKEVANEIYGAYDKSLKAKYENLALGHSLGVFSTWFNGHVATWLREPGSYAEYMKSVDEEGNPIYKKNEYGNQLFFTKEGQIVEQRQDSKYYDEVTGQEIESEEYLPYIDKVPAQVQGILYTLGNAWDVLTNTQKIYNPETGEYVDANNWDEFKKHVWAYDVNRENINKALYDLLMMAIYALLFGTLFTPWYEKEKKKKADNLAEAAILELLYKSSADSFEGFFGPYAVFDYIFNDIKPSAPSVTLNLVKDSYKLIMGDKSFNAFIYGYLPVFRSIKGAVKRQYPETFKSPNSLEN